ncbi:MAG TPA: hypothetical protein VGF94_20160 [Kofleriaceae bacterium]|jgi:hypothetical protein
MRSIASRLGRGRACYRGSVTRPRWHDVLIALAIVVLAVAGAWALRWDDVPPPSPQPATTGPAVNSSAT